MRQDGDILRASKHTSAHYNISAVTYTSGNES